MERDDDFLQPDVPEHDDTLKDDASETDGGRDDDGDPGLEAPEQLGFTPPD